MTIIMRCLDDVYDTTIYLYLYQLLTIYISSSSIYIYIYIYIYIHRRACANGVPRVCIYMLWASMPT